MIIIMHVVYIYTDRLTCTHELLPVHITCIGMDELGLEYTFEGVHVLEDYRPRPTAKVYITNIHPQKHIYFYPVTMETKSYTNFQ